MGALAPIANLIGFSTGGALAGGQASTPPIDNFFGIDSRFLRSPAGGTAIFNNILFGAANEQVPIDFLRLGFYTGVPPIFGGQGFSGLPSQFNLFAGQQGPVGIDAILQLEQQIRGGGASQADAVGNADNKGKTAASISPASIAPTTGGSANSPAGDSKTAILSSSGNDGQNAASNASGQASDSTDNGKKSLGNVLKLIG